MLFHHIYIEFLTLVFVNVAVFICINSHKMFQFILYLKLIIHKFKPKGNSIKLKAIFIYGVYIAHTIYFYIHETFYYKYIKLKTKYSNSLSLSFLFKSRYKVMFY